jgi:hypothetical protein
MRHSPLISPVFQRVLEAGEAKDWRYGCVNA